MNYKNNIKNKNDQELQIFIPISPGELFDKITILEIKCRKIRDKKKIKNIKYELNILKKTAKQNLSLTYKTKLMITRLKNINLKLWDCEGKIRSLGDQNNYNKEFIKTAKKIYKYNDLRGLIKKKINKILNSAIVEEKSYISYILLQKYA